MENLEEAPTRPIAHRDRSGDQLTLAVDGLTDRGKRRSTNQDHFAIAEVRPVLHVCRSSLAQPSVQVADDAGHVLIVADGVGGLRAGECASAMAVAGIEKLLLNTMGWLLAFDGDSVLRELREALRTTDRWVEHASKCAPELEGMGTTLTMAYVSGPSLYVAHAGDSRCYLQRRGQIERLTHDHTLTESLIASGLLTPDQGAHHDLRNVICNAVGAGLPPVQPEVHKHRIESEDALVLCTDGLTDMVPEQDIAEIVDRGFDPSDTCQLLVDEANRRGGKDNITVVVGRFG
jgi:serine/threonine protein phosphatase PrpC